MPEPPGDESLFDRACGGDEEAARQLYERYVDRLLAVARRRIGERLARRVDADDIVQSAFRTFFRRAREGKFVLSERDDLCKLLTRITLNKTLRQANHHRAARRDVNRDNQAGPESEEAVARVLAKGPTPEAICAFMDELEHFFSRLRPQDRQILMLRMDGHTTAEIAQRLGTYERDVYRLLERIRGLAEKAALPC